MLPTRRQKQMQYKGTGREFGFTDNRQAIGPVQ